MSQDEIRFAGGMPFSKSVDEKTRYKVIAVLLTSMGATILALGNYVLNGFTLFG